MREEGSTKNAAEKRSTKKGVRKMRYERCSTTDAVPRKRCENYDTKMRYGECMTKNAIQQCARAIWPTLRPLRKSWSVLGMSTATLSASSATRASPNNDKKRPGRFKSVPRLCQNHIKPMVFHTCSVCFETLFFSQLRPVCDSWQAS